MTDRQRKKYMKEYRKTHREKLAAYGRDWWKRNGWKQNAMRRHKYRRNAAFREAELKRKREARHGLS